VPVALGVNSRVILLDPAFNPQGTSFEEYYRDGRAAADIQLRFMDYQAEYLNRFSDSPMGRPRDFAFYVDTQNVYDAAYFGCPIRFEEGQVADTSPILTGRDKNRIFSFDFDHPLDNPFIRECFARHESLVAAVAKLSVPGMSFKVRPITMTWDGPVTIAVQLRGIEFLTDLVEDPEYAVKLMRFIQHAAEIRNRALAARAGEPVFQGPVGGLADDSIQLIGPAMYRQLVMPLHRTWLALFGPGPHGMHLCGDATRHFPTLHEELNVCSFDTGFPVDHGKLRQELGPDVEIMGGPEVQILLGGTPEAVYGRTKGILQSGVMTGGRFILREANNLPPCCPEANLAAMYQAGLDFGSYL
jgi:uroporphyrinogen-III decarboxylase